MRDRRQLASLGNEELLAVLSEIVVRDRDLTAELLAHLAECDERELPLALGFSSLFAYCTESLGFCEATAWRRVTAARVCRRFPEAFSLVASGALHLSALCLLKPHLNSENAAELFELCSHASARRIEVLLAARFPRPDVSDRIRRLPTRDVSTSDGGSAEPWRARAEAVSRRPEPLSNDRFGLHFTVDGEFLELLERVRGLAGHRLPSGELATLMKRGLEAYERQLEKERFGVGRRARASRKHATPRAGLSKANPVPNSDPNRTLTLGPTPSTRTKASTDRVRLTKRSRYVPPAVAREVYARDGGRCTFVSKDGRRCGARRFLELDHLKPWAMGGEQTLRNLRVCCGAHNRWLAGRHWGTIAKSRS
jgi:hypothetical protein